jgi:hypothetical protein
MEPLFNVPKCKVLPYSPFGIVNPKAVISMLNFPPFKHVPSIVFTCTASQRILKTFVRINSFIRYT